jgi:hypothetical protein
VEKSELKWVPLLRRGEIELLGSALALDTAEVVATVALESGPLANPLPPLPPLPPRPPKPLPPAAAGGLLKAACLATVVDLAFRTSSTCRFSSE